MTKPIDRTTRTVAERTRIVLRENLNSSAHALSPLTDKNPKRYVSGGAVLMPKLPGAALPNKSNIWDRTTYRTGDGEIAQQMRPGADDHLQMKSRGFSV
jgi:hypothetical protein